MRALAFAWRSLVRQPSRTLLGVAGVAAVGALLFDMLLLSRGLIVSFRDLLQGAGFDVRVMATEVPFGSPPIAGAGAVVAAIAALPEVGEVVPVRLGWATASRTAGRRVEAFFNGMEPGGRRPWRLLEGQDLPLAVAGRAPAVVINRALAKALQLAPGDEVTFRAVCGRAAIAAPAIPFRVAGVASFPLDDATSSTATARLSDFNRACGLADDDRVDLLLVASRAGRTPDETVRAIRAARPELHPFSTEEVLAHFQQVGFSYFRQISGVLSSVTLFFGFLLISVLLTVSVNQRLAEIAALRALGFTRRRVVLDVLCQSALLVGAGGLLSLPLGLALSVWLDRILRALPGIPVSVSFFAFEPRALVVHAALLAVTAVLAALYPMRLVARLPIAATLRSEAVT